jgi:hypothetical protein
VPAENKRAKKGRYRYFWKRKRISDPCFPMKIFLGELKGNTEIRELFSWWSQLPCFASRGLKSKESITTACVLYMTYLSLQAGNQGDPDIYKFCLRELGKSSSEIWGWSHNITSPRSYEDFNPGRHLAA